MIPYIVIDQIIIGPVKFYTWGFFVGLGFSAGYLLFYRQAKRAGLAPKKIACLAAAIFFGAIFGAKFLAYVLAGSGAMFMGGLVGAMIFGWGYVKIVKLDFWQIADLLVLPILLGIAIGRIGCILINEHQGAITNLPWGILWPDGLARHPVGVYEMLVGLGLFGVFWLVRKKIKGIMSLRGAPPPPVAGAAQRSNPVLSPLFVDAKSKSAVIPGLTRDPGLDSRLRGNDTKGELLFLFFLTSYSIIRFFLDFTRVASGPLADPRWGVFSVSQWLALLIAAFAVVFFIRKSVEIRRNL